MILPFSTKFKDGKPTYFVQKIRLAIGCPYCEETQDLSGKNISKCNSCAHHAMFTPKLHTIREDVHDRWHAGRMIHPVINNRSKNQFQFAPIFPCISTQKIEIKYDEEETRPEIFVDGKELTIEQHEELAQNDGFLSVWEFYDWFNEDVTGKIIHWTNLKY